MKLLAAGHETPRPKGKRISPTQIDTFYKSLQNGLNVKQAALNAGVSYAWAKLHLSKQPAGARAFREKQIEARIGGPIPHDKLSDRAQRGLIDFDYFRQVYLGHMPTPWQRESAEQIAGLLATDEKEYVVLNMPPGSGKSTMLHDVACWMTVRNREIRGLMGAATSRKANQFLGRIRRSLERITPVKASDEDKRRGISCDAESTLARDYGLFKPTAGGDLWRADAFVVLQHGDELIDEKEPTWSAYGMDQDFLGGRFDLVFWDDLVTRKTLKTAEAIEGQRDWYDSEAESRLEPGGAFFLVGQRLSALDLYRHALDKKLDPEDDAELEALENLDQFDRKAALVDQPGKYRHIVYRAHDEARCTGQHKRDDPYWPDGCLLDPFRLSWRELRGIRANSPEKYATVYQQEDSDPKAAFVKSVWISGGTDPDEGTYHPGCWDNDRGLAELPHNLVGPKYSFATVDPSPTKMWALQWWCVAEGQRVTTPRGEVPIEQIDMTDRVLTRDGFCHVQHVTYMGMKPVLNIGLSNGRNLRVTADHKVLLADGRWVEAGDLTVRSALCAAAPLGSVPAGATSDARVAAYRHGVPADQLVTVDAHGSSVSNVRGADHVGAVVDNLQVIGVDAGRVPAQVVKFAVDGFPAVAKNAVRESVGQTFTVGLSTDHAVSELPLRVRSVLPRSLPLPASGGRDYDPLSEPRLVHPHLATFVQHSVSADVAHAGLGTHRGAALASVHVESIHHEAPTRVFDLGVYGPHEFVAESVVVHNCYVPEASHQLFLLDTVRRSMPGNELLDWNNNTGEFYGVMHEWQRRSVDCDLKIADWILEINAAQRFLLQYDHVRRWTTDQRVNICPHETTMRKADDTFGVDMIRDWFRHGRIRLPGNGLTARTASLKLVEEVTNYGGSLTDDQVMACWFGVKALPELSAGWDIKEVPRFNRPSWLKVVA